MRRNSASCASSISFCASITVGIGAGFVTWVLIKLFRGKASAVHPLMWLVAAAFVIFFAQEILGGTVVG